MQKRKFVIDPGSKFLSVYGDALMYRQPNVAVIRRGRTTEVLAYGDEALAMKTLPDHAVLVRPVSQGVVRQPDVLAAVLRKIFEKLIPVTMFKAVELYVPVPSGLGMVERENVEKAVAGGGYRDVTLIESVMSFLPRTDGGDTMVADFGGGVTDMGVINSEGIVTACTVDIAGDAVDEKIRNVLLQNKNFKIDASAAERVKLAIGSLYTVDTSSVSVIGQDILDLRNKNFEISATQIAPAIHFCYSRIMDILETLMMSLPKPKQDEVRMNGLYIAGGGAAMNGLTDYLQRGLHIPVYMDKDPATAILRYTARLISEPKYASVLKLTGK